MTTQISGDTGVSQVQPVAFDPQTLAQTGYCTLPNGLTMQWGVSGTVSGQEQVTFPVPFTSGVFAYSVTPFYPAAATDLQISCSVATVTVIGLVVDKRYSQGTAAPAPSSTQFSWLAIGV
jgi:hypothetical protein